MSRATYTTHSQYISLTGINLKTNKMKIIKIILAFGFLIFFAASICSVFAMLIRLDSWYLKPTLIHTGVAIICMALHELIPD